MAKKIVRGITDVKTITNQDFDTNNVNDLLSDGQYNYIHRKKGKTEEYHNLTDNIKTLSSDNTELLSVTNYNKTTNTATLHPKHDKQKEQVLESTRDTIAIRHATNGTAEKTTVDTNPQKVLEHENLISDSEYITLNHQQGENTTHIQTAALEEELTNLQQNKQNTINTNTSIGVSETGLRQLYMSKYTFSATGALLKTHIKSISCSNSVEVAEEEFNFIVKFNKDVTNAVFTINTPTAAKFSNIITAYGSDNALTINGCLFTLADRTLTVSRTLNTDKNYVITFSDII